MTWRHLSHSLVISVLLVAALYACRLSTVADDHVGTPHSDLSSKVIGHREFLADTSFAEGFGAAFIYGKREADGSVGSYRQIAPWQVRLILAGPLKQLEAFETRQ